jgi:hypothetical protein
MPRFARTAFDDHMDEHAALVDGKWFYGRVAGTGQVNDDGTSRQAAIALLQPHQEVSLSPEPGNPYDPNAVRVMSSTGQQIGYLETRLAGETVRRSARGIRTRAFVSSLTGSPTQTCGVVIGLLLHS